VNVSLFLARRFLSGRRGGLLGTVSSLALAGVALGTAALVVAMGLMSGYRGELFEKLAGTNAEVLVLPGPEADETATRAALEKVPGVTSVARTAFAPGLLLGPKVPGGVDAVVKGLDVPSGLATTRLLGQDPSLAAKMVPPAPGTPVPVLLGSGLAARLGASEGERVVLETASLSLARGVAAPRRTPLVVAGIVTTGFSEVDEGWAVVPIAAFDRFAPPDARSGVWELKLRDPGRPDAVVAAAREALGPGATVLDWKTLNGDLFRALLVQQTLLFVVLALIVAVAAGTVVSSVVVLVAQKTREIGVLSAIGAGPRTVARTFRLAGLAVGGAGVLLGTVTGVAVCALLTATKAVRFPAEIARVYYISWMPFRPEPRDVLAIAVVGLLLVLAAAAFPARRAARLAPADALRYE
jgi:lipoprotein-releasing system permease protein